MSSLTSRRASAVEPGDGGDVLVVADGVSRTFGSGATAVVAVHGTSCTIREGERIALTGPSGSGKTTLVNLLAGLDDPTTGSIAWPAIGERQDLRPGPVAVVFQAASLLPPLTVIENAELPLLLQGEDPAAAREAACAALDELDLLSLGDKLPEELSGGQAQRVAVARATVGRPRLVLADEPTGQLDHASAEAVVDALLSAVERIGAALLVNTHDETVSARLPIRWRMDDGRLMLPFETVEERLA